MIRDGPEYYEVAAGQTATIRCNAVADSSLNLTIEWLRGDWHIDFELEPHFVESDASLTIHNTTVLDTGDYTCVAKTILDTATAKTTIIVQGPSSVLFYFKDWFLIFIWNMKHKRFPLAIEIDLIRHC